jgi:hypothetical protein
MKNERAINRLVDFLEEPCLLWGELDRKCDFQLSPGVDEESVIIIDENGCVHVTQWTRKQDGYTYKSYCQYIENKRSQACLAR